LVDKFLADATECDIDVIADFSGGGDERALVCGVLEHIEEAGIHSGDSACTIPAHSLKPAIVDELKALSRKLAQALKVRGLMNVQWAIKDDQIYVIEVNPRASRTVPFVGKATGVSWARVAAKVMIGKQLSELGVTEEVTPKHTSVKESVFPFGKFPGVDVILGPEMRSTGECMGADPDFAVAFAKSQMSANAPLPTRHPRHAGRRRHHNHRDPQDPGGRPPQRPGPDQERRAGNDHQHAHPQGRRHRRR